MIPTLATGGAERTTLDVAAALATRGDRALVASAGGRMLAELAALGAEHRLLPLAAKNPVRMAANARALRRIICDEGVGIVHARSRAPAWSALLAARAAGVPLVTTYHGIYNERGPAKRLYNSVMARGDRVIANSLYTAGIVAARHGTPPERLVVIPRGTDLSRFRPAAVTAERLAAMRARLDVRAGDRLLLNVARLTGWKGQTVLIEAFARIAARHPDLVLVLAGDDQGRTGYRAALEEQVRRLDLGRRVRLPGHVEDVPAALALATVAAVASIEPEAFGRAAVEAQAFGLATIVTRIGAAPETVLAPPHVPEDARTGWHVPPGDAEALAEAIEAALALGPSERAALGERARAQADRFSLAAMTGATLAVYDELMAARGGVRQ